MSASIPGAIVPVDVFFASEVGAIGGVAPNGFLHRERLLRSVDFAGHAFARDRRVDPDHGSAG